MLGLAFGGSPNPANWTAISEMVTDLPNEIVIDENWDPKKKTLFPPFRESAPNLGPTTTCTFVFRSAARPDTSSVRHRNLGERVSCLRPVFTSTVLVPGTWYRKSNDTLPPVRRLSSDDDSNKRAKAGTSILLQRPPTRCQRLPTLGTIQKATCTFRTYLLCKLCLNLTSTLVVVEYEAESLD